MQHTEDQENTGVVEGSGEEQQPDLTAALTRGPPAENDEADESDAGAENGQPLALPAPTAQNGIYFATSQLVHSYKSSAVIA